LTIGSDPALFVAPFFVKRYKMRTGEPFVKPDARSTTRVLLMILVLSAGTTCRAAATNDVPLAAKPYYAQIARLVARHLPHGHLSRAALDDDMSTRAWTNYLAALDFGRVYFLQSDIDRFREQQTQIDDLLRNGELDFAYDVFEIFKERVANRTAFVADILEKGFDVDRDESFHWRRKDMPWPQDEADWNEIWRKRLKNEYVRMLIGRRLGEPDETVLEDKAETEGDTAPPRPLEAIILDRYRQVSTVFEDSEAEYVLEKFLSAVAQAYDPHSAYMAPSTLEDFDIEMKLSLVGIGALLRSEDGAAKVVRLIPGGPADRDRRDKRLRPGDKIIGVGQDDAPIVNTLHWPLSKTVRQIRGEKGSRVVLRVIPASDPTGSTTRLVDLVRDEVKLEEQAANLETHTIEARPGTNVKLAVIRIPAFYANMHARSVFDPEFRSSAYDVGRFLEQAKAGQVDGVVLDLRNNGGGSLLEAIRMSGLFITTGPIVQVKERYSVRVLPDDDARIVYAGPLLVLVNRLSASASEILAGAIQDYGRGIVVGDSKTHGKGTVQSIVDVGRDERLGACKITSASYYRISGSSTQLRGIIPDIIIPSSYDFLDVGEDHLPNPVPWSSIDPVKYEPFDRMGPLIPELRQRSLARRAKSDRFEAYGRLLSRIEELNNIDEVPLGLQPRLKMAQAERELTDLQERLAEESTGPVDDEDKGPDLILDESLRILSDLIILEKDGQNRAASSGQEGGRPWRHLQDWLRSKL
jgi:carboxyl-terminal processing protease